MTHPEVTLWANFKSPTGQGYTQDGKPRALSSTRCSPASPVKPSEGGCRRCQCVGLWLDSQGGRGAASPVGSPSGDGSAVRPGLRLKAMGPAGGTAPWGRCPLPPPVGPSELVALGGDFPEQAEHRSNLANVT